YRIEVAGGTPQLIANQTGRGAAWNQAGTILFASGINGPLSRVAASGGEPVTVTRVDSSRQVGHRFPQFLPDGPHFLYYTQGSSEASGIYLGSLDGGEPKLLTAADTAAQYLKPYWVVFVRQGTLVARRLDLANEKLVDDPVILADPVAYDSAALLGAFSI